MTGLPILFPISLIETSNRSGAGGACAGPPLKKALQEGRTILFIDESGISQRPHRVRTWSPRGETPVLEYNFNWDTLSAVAGITFYSFYFRLYQGTVKSAEVVDFLQALLRHLSGPLLIVWDRLSAHRSRITRDFMAGQGQRLWVAYLLGYAPELSPVECGARRPICRFRFTAHDAHFLSQFGSREPCRRSS